MIHILDILTIQFIAILTFIISFITARQAHRAWNWPWSLQIPEGANGRWKLDWGIALFLIGISIDYQIDVFRYISHPKHSTVSAVFHGFMMVLIIWIFKFMKHEYRERR